MKKRGTNLTSAAAPPATGTRLQSIEQAAIQAQDRMAKPHEPGAPYDFERSHQDWEAIHRLERRGHRGGAAVRKGHMTGNC